MAGRSAHVRRISTDARGPERRRSSSHGDATPRVPAPPTLLHPHDHSPSPMRSPSPSPAPSAQNAGSTAGTSTSGAADHGPRRLGFLGDILQLPSAGHLVASSSQLHSQLHSSHLGASPASLASSSQRSGATPTPSAFLPARSQSRADSALPRDGAHSPAPSSMAAQTNQPNKGHASPSKKASGIGGWLAP
ncbi:hypothetical protein K466DRAFT_668467 [Polyporus arcularius HHB13444]|uniref:Uncharacterized protein n=1 Tax=Polyporus arcularius HHB13444 TaxID=1314778 RepID=A0A5C3NM84_9APHY|nr:hypothetical protein K466DRAFT_668467 [Polyporus arcularius HHB13444]